MTRNNKAPGYIMIVTLMLISLIVALVSYLANRSTPYLSFINVVMQREKAKLLAFGGIQMAMSQLAWAAAEPEEKKKATTEADKKKTAEPEEQDKRFLETILPYLNRWQEIGLTKEKDGIEGKIYFAISCEQGKLDINQIYDFEDKKFVGEGEKIDYKKIMQEFFSALGKEVGEKKMFDSFATFLKNRDYPLNDATELLTSKPFERFKYNIFYIPPTEEKKGAMQQQKRPIYLTDIFTTRSGSKTIEPWLLSDSMCGLLNLEQVKPGDTEKRKNNVKKWLESFKITTTWEEDWDEMLAPVYGKKFNVVPKYIKPLLATKFGPTVFSVLSYGNVGEVTQRFLAIIEKDKPSQKDGRAIVTLRKLYWL